MLIFVSRVWQLEHNIPLPSLLPLPKFTKALDKIGSTKTEDI